MLVTTFKSEELLPRKYLYKRTETSDDILDFYILLYLISVRTHFQTQYGAIVIDPTIP